MVSTYGTPSQASKLFTRGFERPANVDRESEKRSKFAEDFTSDKMQLKTTGTLIASLTSSAKTSSISSSIQTDSTSYAASSAMIPSSTIAKSASSKTPSTNPNQFYLPDPNAPHKPEGLLTHYSDANFLK